MKFYLTGPVLLTFLFVLSCTAIDAQSGENGASNIGKPDEKESMPRTMKEQLKKMEIEKEKKDFQEMLDRSEEAAKLSDQVERAVENRGALTNEDKAKIDDVERLVKKIRSELGGSGDDDSDDNPEAIDKPPTDVVSGVKYLRDSTAKLMEELKKTSRFSISAMAIQSSNAVLKAARFLRFGK